MHVTNLEYWYDDCKTACQLLLHSRKARQNSMQNSIRNLLQLVEAGNKEVQLTSQAAMQA